MERDHGLGAVVEEPLIAPFAALTGLVGSWFPPARSRQPRRERSAQAPAPKEQPPRKLSGKRTAWRGQHLERGARALGLDGVRRRDNTRRHSDRWGFDGSLRERSREPLRTP